MNYLVMERTLLFRTAPGTKLRALLTCAVAALETDGIENANREPWGPGLKEHLICLKPTEVSGRRFAVTSSSVGFWFT